MLKRIALFAILAVCLLPLIGPPILHRFQLQSTDGVNIAQAKSIQGETRRQSDPYLSSQSPSEGNSATLITPKHFAQIPDLASTGSGQTYYANPLPSMPEIGTKAPLKAL